MPKKRRTRRQKEQRTERSTQAPRLRQVDTTLPAATVVTAPSAPLATSTDPEHQARLKAMRTSLSVFLVLALIQIVVWWSLRSGLLPESWTQALLG